MFVELLMDNVHANKVSLSLGKRKMMIFFVAQAKVFARKIEVWWEQMKFPEAPVGNCVEHAVECLS